jgi:DMSO/TMAO reductase YedYZ molybdopterin-dependent catalytic subunit
MGSPRPRTDRLRIDGQVQRPCDVTYEELSGLDEAAQIRDVRRFGHKRRGGAVTLAALLQLVGPTSEARYLGLHSSADNFHASIPLAPIADRALLIYCLDGRPLAEKAGGPFRFFIPDHAACHVAEIDECANVKYVDHIELTAERGFDNRPEDDVQHQRLHGRPPAST